MGNKTSSRVSQTVNQVMQATMDSTQSCGTVVGQLGYQSCNVKMVDCHGVSVTCNNNALTNTKCMTSSSAKDTADAMAKVAGESSADDSTVIPFSFGKMTKSEVVQNTGEIVSALQNILNACDTAVNQDTKQEVTVDCESSTQVVIDAVQNMGANTACKLVSIEDEVQKLATALDAKSSSKMSGGIIVAIVIACLVVLAIIIVIIYFAVKNKKAGTAMPSMTMPVMYSAPAPVPVPAQAPAQTGGLRRRW
jgi:enamine deaminase RidA (YjgF/YER057c/UK114 family)